MVFMEQEILKKLQEQEKKIDEIYRSVEKTRKFFFWTLIISIAVFVIPLIGLLVIIPQFLNIYSGSMTGF